MKKIKYFTGEMYSYTEKIKKLIFNLARKNKTLKFDKTIAIFYPCTRKEYDSGSLFKSLNLLVSTSPSSNFSFDVFLFFDVDFSIDHSAFDKYLKHNFINKINIQFLKLIDKNNVYIQPWGNDKFCFDNLPRHGLSSGPNQSFYKSLYYLIGLNNGYENFLLLETDIQILKNNWYDCLKDYCSNNSFLIAGSKYKGVQKWHRILEYKDHLNGVALYKNCTDLLHLLKESENYLINKISKDNPFMNFDIAIDEWRRTSSGRSFFKKSAPLVDVEFITNVCDPADRLISKQKILKFHPETIFLHHKTSEDNLSFTSLGQKFDVQKSKNFELGLKYFNYHKGKREIPMFFHIPKNAGTFCESLITVMLRKFNRDYFLSWPKEIRLKNKGDELFNIYVIDDKIIPNDSRFKKIESITYSVELSDLNKDFFKDLNVFSVTINSLGFRDFNWIFSFFNHDDFCFTPFCVLREPLERSVSMFEYNNSSISSHDLNHGTISYDSYIEYINSIRFEDAWLIRNLLNIPDSIEVDDEIYKNFTQLFDLFKVFFIRNNDLVSKDIILKEPGIYSLYIEMGIEDIRIRKETFQVFAVIDGERFAMSRDNFNPDLWTYDYKLPKKIDDINYYFEAEYKLILDNGDLSDQTFTSDPQVFTKEDRKVADVYDSVYNLHVDAIPKEWYDITHQAKNENKLKKIKANALEDSVKQSFYSKSKYDYKIYNEYVK